MRPMTNPGLTVHRSRKTKLIAQCARPVLPSRHAASWSSGATWSTKRSKICRRIGKGCNVKPSAAPAFHQVSTRSTSLSGVPVKCRPPGRLRTDGLRFAEISYLAGYFGDGRGDVCPAERSNTWNGNGQSPGSTWPGIEAGRPVNATGLKSRNSSLDEASS